VFTDKVKERSSLKADYFDNMKYFGFRHVVGEIDRKENEVVYVSAKDIKNCDYVLVSLTSFYDVYNLVNELYKTDRGKCKIVVGGAGVTNIRVYKDLIDFACFGRGEGIINDLLNGKIPKNVWSKEVDPDLLGEYEIGKLKCFIGDEKSVGCKKKCFFCQYSWKNYFVSRKKSKAYTSGYGEYEDFFLSSDWRKAGRGHVVTAMDGVTEQSRFLVNKGMTNEEVIEHMMKFYELPAEKYYRLKIYQIIGYPWEDKETVKLQELKYILRKADKPSKTHKLYIYFHFTHFTPMQLTPMWFLEFNTINFHWGFRNSWTVYEGKNIVARIGQFSSSVIPAFEELFMERGTEEDYKLMVNILLSRKYRNLPWYKKVKVYKQYFPHILRKQEKITVDYLISPYNYLKTSELLKNKLKKMGKDL